MFFNKEDHFKNKLTKEKNKQLIEFFAKKIFYKKIYIYIVFIAHVKKNLNTMCWYINLYI